MTNARTYRTQAITLKSSPFSERDRLLTVFTPRYGKLRVLAKGVRRTASRLSGHVVVFSFSNLFLVHGRTFDLVTQGDTIEQYPVLHEDLWRLSQAFYAAELVDRFTEEQHQVPGIFEALLLMLRRLADTGTDAALTVLAFEIELLGLTGYRPQLYRCVGCNSEIHPGANAFSNADGGVLCPACAPRTGSQSAVGDDALRIVRNLQTRPEQTLSRLKSNPRAIEEAERLLIGYIQYLLDVRIKSVGFMDVVRSLHPAFGK